ncbi:hypothetical protein NVV56_19510 [Aeromonas dhakensis]|uniref:hypothetical protein n=1 Tax=Aeromonas dhakensis TaxID=196024 RepID=UPI002157843D|nr:hypothetical protein [Aeromonas dhakensis]MCR6741078.1 hypothetical protein [Aeromonas dhakensis]
MSSYRWGDREAFFLYNLCVVNKFNIKFSRCVDIIKKPLMRMKIELDNVVIEISENDIEQRRLFKELLDSLLIDFRSGSLDTAANIRKYMLMIYSGATIDSKVMAPLYQDERARLYTFASLRIACDDDGLQRFDYFGGAFLDDAQKGLFNYDIEMSLSKADQAKYIERCADMQVCNRNTFLSHLKKREETLRDLKMVRWVINNEDKIVWAWFYLIRNRLNGVDPGWIVYDGKSESKLKKQCGDALMVFYDLLRNKTTKDYIIKTLSSACSKKRHSDKSKKRTSLHYPLCRQAERMLEALAIMDNKAPYQVIEDLIFNESKDRGFKLR